MSCNYNSSENDDQIDISPVFLDSDGASLKWDNIFDEESMIENFELLDKGKTYFMRTGQTAGAGHYQLLYFKEEKEKKRWFLFSTITNQGYCTDKDGRLTIERGQSLKVAQKEKCGDGEGQYSILLQEVTVKTIIAALYFISDYRMHNGSSNERDAHATQKLYVRKKADKYDGKYFSEKNVRPSTSIHRQGILNKM